MLEIKNGKIRRGNYSLSKIDLHIERGSLNIVVGKNASGKSSLLQTMMGTLLLEEGTMTKDDIRIGYVGNELPFNPSLTSLLVGELIQSLDENFSLEVFYSHLKRFKITKNLRIRELSSGQQKLLLLSIALSRDVDLLIFDEISINIDVLRKEALREIFQSFILSGDKAIVISTNHLEVFEDIADRLIYIKDNEVYYSGTIVNLLDRYRLWQGSKKEFEKIENVLAYEESEYSVEALIKASKIGDKTNLKNILIYLEKSKESLSN